MRFSVTPAGVGLASGGALTYAAGVWLGYPLLVTVAAGGFAALLLAAVAVAIRPRVALRRQVTPPRVTVGESAAGLLTVRNTSRWPSLGFTAVDLVGDEPVALAVPALPASGTRELPYAVPAHRRGRIRLGPLTVERRDPLGLLAWRQRQTADAVLWVHPPVHPLRPLPVGVVLDYEGRVTDNARAGTVTFASLREYVPGDDPRHIHWRSTARLGTLVVREHVDTTEPTTTVVLDTGAGAYVDPAAFEHAVAAAASVVRAVEETGRPVTLRIAGEAPGDAESTLDRLALAAPRAGAADLVGLVDRVPAGGALVVVTGTVDPVVLARLADLRRRFAPVVVASLAAPADAPGTVHRRPGMAVLTAGSAIELVAAWNRMIRGEVAA